MKRQAYETNRNFYRRLRNAGLLYGTITRALKLRKKRDQLAASGPPPWTLKQMVERGKIPLNLGGVWGNWCFGRARQQRPRVQNWLSSDGRTDRLGDRVEIREIDNGRYSSRCTYTHWTYQPIMEAWAWLMPNGGVRVHIGGFVREFKQPRGYRWNRDIYGLRLVNTRGDDYHPTASDLVDLEGEKIRLIELTAKLRENARTRRAEAARQRQEKRARVVKEKQERQIIRKAEREGARVRMADSLRAGNCEAGTKSWCRRHGINHAGCYTPSQLLGLANGDRQRVSLVVAVALRRHRREMEVGFCEI